MSGLVSVNLDRSSAGRANENRILLEPSKSLDDLILTLRAIQRDGLIVKHNGVEWDLLIGMAQE